MVLNPAQEVNKLQGDLGGGIEGSRIVVETPSTGSLGSFTATAPAAAEAVQGDYLHFVLPGGDKVAAWLNIDGDDTPPSGALYVAADIKVTAEIGPTDTAAQVAAAIADALDGIGDEDMTITADDEVLTFASDLLGALTTPVSKVEDDSGAGSIVVAVVAVGSVAGIQNKYMTLENLDGDKFYLWFNVNGEGVDPAIDGDGTEVELVASASAPSCKAQVLSALQTLTDFEAKDEGAAILVSLKANGNPTDMGAGNSGFLVTVNAQGSATREASSQSPGSISNNPSPF